MEKSLQKTGQVSLPYPVFVRPEKQSHLEANPNGGLVTVYHPTASHLKISLPHEIEAEKNQVKNCGCWIKGLGLSAPQLGDIDVHNIQGVRR